MQAASAGGIGVLAILVGRFGHGKLKRRERIGVAVFLSREEVAATAAATGEAGAAPAGVGGGGDAGRDSADPGHRPVPARPGSS